MYQWWFPDFDGCAVVLQCSCLYVMHTKDKEWQSIRLAGYSQMAPPSLSQVRCHSLTVSLGSTGGLSDSTLQVFTCPGIAHLLKLGPSNKTQKYRIWGWNICVYSQYKFLAYLCDTKLETPSCLPSNNTCLTILASTETGKGRILHSIIITVKIWIHKVPSIWRMIK